MRKWFVPAVLAACGCAPHGTVSHVDLRGTSSGSDSSSSISMSGTVYTPDFTDPAAASSGQIGCASDDIDISQDETKGPSGTRTWTAACGSKTYFCSHRANGETSCAPAPGGAVKQSGLDDSPSDPDKTRLTVRSLRAPRASRWRRGFRPFDGHQRRPGSVRERWARVD